MQITMLTLSASPEGVLEQGRTYEVPGDISRERAQQLLDGGAATRVDQPKPTPKAPKEEGGPLDKLTVEQLLAYAAENELDLAGATKKADLIAAIKTAETGGAAEPEGT